MDDAIFSEQQVRDFAAFLGEREIPTTSSGRKTGGAAATPEELVSVAQGLALRAQDVFG